MVISTYIQQILNKYELNDIHEMIYELQPKGYNLPSSSVKIGDIKNYPVGTQITTYGYIDKYEVKPMHSNKISRISAKLYRDGESVFCYWTCAKNKTSSTIFALEQKSKNGLLVQVTGKVKNFSFSGGGEFKFIDSPKLSGIDGTIGNNAMFLVPEPLYVLKDNTKVSQIQLAFKKLLEDWDSYNKSEFLPLDLEEKLGLRGLYESIQFTHGLRPIKNGDTNLFLEDGSFRKRLTAEKVWSILKKGIGMQTQQQAGSFKISDTDINNIKQALTQIPFTLTNDQKKAIWHTMQEFQKRNKSKSLIFGDVGSGKTMVSLILAHVLLLRGTQVSIIAPTSILAKQHYEEAKKIFPNSQIAIVHSKTTQKEKNRINSLLKSGQPMIVYGTTSANKLNYTNLSLVVIDEEQKFGVKDKEYLYNRTGAHLIFMTATPIPRTLASTMFSDFEVQKIEEKPAMQKPRITKIQRLQEMEQNEILEIKNRMRNKEQTLVIVPSIVSDEMMSVNQAFDKYSYYFPDFKIAVINGKMKPDDIEKTTESFMKGEFDILIATTMVDSGFSNKMLSHVFIESAERFGISQLHQIRGRVGRGSLQGYCYLSPGVKDLKETSLARLEGVVATENGFELSLTDISIRGSGNLTGIEQSGNDENFLNWIEEIEIMREYLANQQKYF